VKYKKVTEGVGYISGDAECWRIRPIPYNEWAIIYGSHTTNDGMRVYSDDYLPYAIIGGSTYPSDVIPENIQIFGMGSKIRYKVVFEAEIL